MHEIIYITVISGDEKQIIETKKANLLEVIKSAGYFINAPCGGRGRCGKCTVKLLSGKVDNAEVDADGYVLACKANICQDITIEINEASGYGITLTNNSRYQIDGVSGYGIAVDIGTTTLAFYLMNLKSGEEIDSFSCLNPQAVYGGDVISRITACSEGKLKDLNKIIIKKTNEIITYFQNKHSIKAINSLTACGNTTMMHLFAGEDVSSMGVYPFKPMFIKTMIKKGEELKINAQKVTLLPSVSAFVGSDITAGLLSTGITEIKQNSMLIDIGTNGEIALYANGSLFCASTAAGPALEGANIACGMGGVSGAIDTAYINNGKIEYTVIGGGRPQGICGSGLIDIIAALLELNIMDETGAFNDEYDKDNIIKDDKYFINEDIYISQKDIREFQLAKSAICAGVKALTKKAGICLNEIENFFIAGGLGYYINYKSALKTGLLPEETSGKITITGNSAGAGAKMCLLSENQTRLCQAIADSCNSVELAADSFFMEEYINNMSF